MLNDLKYSKKKKEKQNRRIFERENTFSPLSMKNTNIFYQSRCNVIIMFGHKVVQLVKTEKKKF